MKEVLLYVWQLPQNLLGLALYKIYKGHEICTKEVCGNGIKCKLSPQMAGGITLGKYIIVNNPSLIHAGLHSKVCKDKNYYHFYTEHWLFPEENK